MTIFLMRHAQADSNLNVVEKSRVGDAQVSITETGWGQATSAGQFLGPYLLQNNFTTWPRFWISSLLRPQQTLSGVFHGMGPILPGEPEVFENSNLVEQSFGWLPYLLEHPEDEIFKDIPPEKIKEFSALMLAFSKKVYAHGKYLAQPPFGDSPAMLCGRVSSLFETLRRDRADGVKDHFIATHGAVIKAIMKEAFHLPMSAWDKLETPGNCDIFRIDEDPETGRLLGIRKIYSGPEGGAVDLNPLAGLKPSAYGDLPPLPEFLRRGQKLG